MATNTLRHLSDMANSVFIDRTNTIWKSNPNVVTLQDALETLQTVAITNVYATNTRYGMVRLAKDTEIEKGVGSNTDVITSAQLLKFNGKPEATYTIIGTTQYATEAQTIEGTSEKTSVNPKQLQNKLLKTNAKTNAFGTIKLSTEAMVIPGTDNTTAMTPKLVKYAIDNLVPSFEVSNASEEITGTVILANIQTTLAGKVRTGYAVSPFSFSNANATPSEFGTVRFPTATELKNGAFSGAVAMSAKDFVEYKATNTKDGLIKTATETDVKSKKGTDKAVTPQSIAFLLNKIEQLENEMNAVKVVDGVVPIGATIYSFALPTAGSNFMLVNGDSLLVKDYPELFALIGYKYGGSGSTFNLPDKRGLYTKTVGKGTNITGPLAEGVEAIKIGEVQAQQVRKHKHVGSWGVDRRDNAFGYTKNSWHAGSGRHDYNNPRYYTNDGTEWNGNPNPDGTIGNETRPWTMGQYELIRVK